MKHIFSIFSIILFVVIAIGSIDEETSKDLEKKEKILKINPDTKEGRMVLDTIMKMDYNQMVNRFGSSFGFTEFSFGTYECAWINIYMKKGGIDVWCTPYFEYSSDTNRLIEYRLSVCD